MDREAKEFVAKRCLQVERKLAARLTREIEALARIIAKTVKTLPTKEDVLSLQEELDELRRL
jgi:hypothetical protein